jgi:hypothetical protein
MKGRIVWLLLAVLALAVAGCAPTLPSNRADLDIRVKKLRNIALLPPETKIFELSAGGVREQRDDWSASGQKNLEKAIIDNLKGKVVDVKILKVTNDLETEIDEVKTLYRVVMDSIYSHAYYWQGQNPNFFPDRLKNFDYSVGSVDKLLKKQNADGLILVEASDEISSAGRKALRVVQAINPFGVAGRSGNTIVKVAVVDRKGDILWDSFYFQSGGYDLRDFDSTRDFVKVLLEDLPREGK